MRLGRHGTFSRVEPKQACSHPSQPHSVTQSHNTQFISTFFACKRELLLVPKMNICTFRVDLANLFPKEQKCTSTVRLFLSAYVSGVSAAGRKEVKRIQVEGRGGKVGVTQAGGFCFGQSDGRGSGSGRWRGSQNYRNGRIYHPAAETKPRPAQRPRAFPSP